MIPFPMLSLTLSIVTSRPARIPATTVSVLVSWRGIAFYVLDSAIVTCTALSESAILFAYLQYELALIFRLVLSFTRRSIKEGLRALRWQFSSSLIIVVSMTDDRATVDDLVCEADDFINKAVRLEILTEALSAFREGDVVMGAPEADTIFTLLLEDRQEAG